MYRELKGVCKMCLGCTRLADKSFLGVEECSYMPQREKRV